MTGRLSAERWRELEPWLDELLEAEPAARKRRLAQIASEDAALAADLEGLLAAHDDPPTILRGPLEADTPEPPTQAGDPRVGTVVGGYRLVRRLGQGGMATVYLGERADGAFEHRVAVKLVRSDAASEAVLRRLADEQRILARLNHPHIARLFGGGLTDDGQPFILMELVAGTPITHYCDRRRLTVGERLELFGAACEAVEYAHGNLVVHRDLKPSNILVSDDGEVKLLDFGIAKVVQPEAGSSAEKGTVTSLYGHPMTPEFAAPEQFEGGPITTATDVYALGVVLYELLTGRRPHGGGLLPHQLAMSVLETEPERPSSAVRRAPAEAATAPSSEDPVVAAAAARSATPARLAARLRGDLDTIVLTALRRDPARRYGAVGNLRDDLERHRQLLPIRARPESVGYLASRFVRRHAVVVALAGLVLASLVGGLTASLASQRAARREAATAERVSQFLVDLFRTPDPTFGGGGSMTAAQLLDEAATRLDGDLTTQPEIRARLLQTIGESYQGIGVFDRAEPMMTASIALLTEAEGADHPDTIAARNALAGLYRVTGRLAEAGDMYRELLATADAGRVPPDVEFTIANDYGVLLGEQGELDRAEALYLRALALHRRLGSLRSQEGARTLSNLGMVRRQQGDLDQAASYLRQALAIQREVLGEPHADVATSLNNLAAVVRRQGDLDEAETLYRAALEQRRQLLGESHPAVAQSLNNVGFVRLQRGDLDGAADFIQRAYETWRAAFDGDHPRLADGLTNLGQIRRRQGRFDEADDLLRRATEMCERLYGTDHPAVAEALQRWAGCRVDAGRVGDAVPLLERALAISRTAAGDGDARTVELAVATARAHHRLGHERRAAAVLRPVATAVAAVPELRVRVDEALAEIGSDRD